MPRRCLSLILLPLMLAACGGGAAPREAAPVSRWAGMNNPASQYCAELGGRLEIRAEQAGEAGYCHLPDGSVLEEWELHRGKNAL
jgi:uncharacterized protein